MPTPYTRDVSGFNGSRMPWSPTQYFPHPLANIRPHSTKPSVANLASYGIVEVMMWEGLGDLINRFRRKELGLDPLDAIRAPTMNHRLQIPYAYLWYVEFLRIYGQRG